MSTGQMSQTKLSELITKQKTVLKKALRREYYDMRRYK